MNEEEKKLIREKLEKLGDIVKANKGFNSKKQLDEVLELMTLAEKHSILSFKEKMQLKTFKALLPMIKKTLK